MRLDLGLGDLVKGAKRRGSRSDADEKKRDHHERQREKSKDGAPVESRSNQRFPARKKGDTINIYRFDRNFKFSDHFVAITFGLLLSLLFLR